MEEEAARKLNLELLEIVAMQEESLQLDHFNAADAWQLGLILRDMFLKTGADMALVKMLGIGGGTGTTGH